MQRKRFACRDYKINYSIQCEEISDNGNWVTYGQIVDLLNDLSKENERLKKDRFICLDCKHSGYVEIGCLCEYNDHWQEHINECEDFKES